MGSVVLMGAAPAAALRQNKNQAPRPPGNGGTAPARDGVLATVPGTLVDLSAGFSGQVLYCTAEGEVGAFFGGDHGILAPLGTFAGQSLRAVTATPSEDIAVLTSAGDIYLLPGGGLPPVLTYDDLYMVLDPTDLMCDAAGNFLIASSTPSNGQRGLNWVSPGGDRWAYYLVQHSVHMPVQLAHDPLTGSVIFSDETGGGTLHRVIPGDSTHTTAPFETVLQPGIQSSLDDGDVVFECDGDYYWIAGNRIFFHNRSAGTTSLFQQLTHTLRGVAIAPASGDLASSGYSLYVAEGDDPTIVREYANVGIPAASFAPDQGWVPGKGFNMGVTPGFQIFEMAVDNAGHLLIGGGLFGTTYHLSRIELPNRNLSVIADDTMGLVGILEGIVMGVDDTIYVVTREGVIQAIQENPFSVTTIFSDPTDQINAAKDLAIGLDGRFYIAERAGWGFGGVVEVNPMNGFSVVRIVDMSECRGIAPNPAGGMYATEWNGTGFEGGTVSIDLGTNTFVDVPGFHNINYTNAAVWGDGDILVDSTGRIYTVSEDDWSLTRYLPGQPNIERIGSSYLDHVSGLAVAQTSTGLTSTTGWSLYISEWTRIWEKPDAPAPGPTIIDNSAALRMSTLVPTRLR